MITFFCHTYVYYACIHCQHLYWRWAVRSIPTWHMWMMKLNLHQHSVSTLAALTQTQMMTPSPSHQPPLRLSQFRSTVSLVVQVKLCWMAAIRNIALCCIYSTVQYSTSDSKILDKQHKDFKLILISSFTFTSSSSSFHQQACEEDSVYGACWCSLQQPTEWDSSLTNTWTYAVLNQLQGSPQLYEC